MLRRRGLGLPRHRGGDSTHTANKAAPTSEQN